MVLPEITHKLPHYKPIKNTFYLKKVFFIEPQTLDGQSKALKTRIIA